ncbi:MAG TPA: FAD-dependent oxidoreductase [Solirubrobacteraceae bacterium]|nr:FAD-dependent oxidoreductase [Solirubrobacteraceae bacterium]
MTRGRLVIAGAGLAGLRAAQAARAAGHEGEIVLAGDEPHPPYTRPPLSKELLKGEQTAADCAFPGLDALEAELRLDTPITAVDTGEHTVTLADGTALGYERLILATGARARELPVPGADAALTLRSLDDAERLGHALEGVRRLAIIGAGFIGCEVAASARHRGIDVALVDLAPQPLLPLGPELGARVADLHRAHGVALHLGASIERVEAGKVAREDAGKVAREDAGKVCPPQPDKSSPPSAAAAAGQLRSDGTAAAAGQLRSDGTAAVAVLLSDGTRIAADLVLIAVGAAPNTDFLRDSGIELTADGGVVCDATLTSVSDPDVLAAGDVACWPLGGGGPISGERVRVEHWTTAAEHGRLAGQNAVREPAERVAHVAPPYFWSDQYDVKIQSVGFPSRADRIEIVEEGAGGDGVVRLVAEARTADGELIGAVAFNHARRLAEYRRRLATATTTATPAPGAATA